MTKESVFKRSTWGVLRRNTIAQVMGCHEAEWGEGDREIEAQENSRCPATDYTKENPCLPSSYEQENIDNPRRPP